jgi:hypothetical protein
VRFERLERLMVLEKVRTGETEHEAGFPMARQYRQTAITVALFGGSGCSCCCERSSCSLPSPETGKIRQQDCKAAQNHEPELCFHIHWDKVIPTYLYNRQFSLPRELCTCRSPVSMSSRNILFSCIYAIYYCVIYKQRNELHFVC